MKHPHLTPSHLFPKSKLPGIWSQTRIAYVCFTPYPEGFEAYVKEVSKERLFLHSPPSELRFCSHNNVPFLVISEVYGFAVGTTTIEELVHYGIDTIIGVGYVGAFNGAAPGEKFIASSAMSDLPLASHYGYQELEPVLPSRKLNRYLKEHLKDRKDAWGAYPVWNSNSLYREYEETVDKMKKAGCEVVNMDTLSVFSAGELCRQESSRSIEYAYLGTVTDSSGTDGDWESDLMAAIDGDKGDSHVELVKILVEELVPGWILNL